MKSAARGSVTSTGGAGGGGPAGPTGPGGAWAATARMACGCHPFWRVILVLGDGKNMDRNLWKLMEYNMVNDGYMMILGI